MIIAPKPQPKNTQKSNIHKRMNMNRRHRRPRALTRTQNPKVGPNFRTHRPNIYSSKSTYLQTRTHAKASKQKREEKMRKGELTNKQPRELVFTCG